MEDEFGEVQRKQFHAQEVIPAVTDEWFLGDEDDEYDDLYDDINIGEGFHQILQKSELGFRKEDEDGGNKVEVVVKTQKEEVVGLGWRRKGMDSTCLLLLGLLNKFRRHQEPMLDRLETQVEGIEFEGDKDASSSGSTVIGGKGANFGQLGMGRQVAGNNDELNKTDTSVQQAGSYIGDNAGSIDTDGGGGPSPPAGGGMGVLGGGSSNASVYGGMVLFIGDLHWWTTDADLESEMSKYGHVKEAKFYEEKASGKSKGFAQAEFCDPAALVACKEGMNNHVFNGRPCVVAITSPNNIRMMGEARMNKHKSNQGFSQAQGRREPGDASYISAGGIVSNANYEGGNSGRNVGKMGWGRGGQGMMDGRQSGPMKNGAGAGGRNVLSDGEMDNNGRSGFFGQSLATFPLLHPQAMMGQGCDPTYGGPMGRAGCHGGCPGTAPLYTRIFPPFHLLGPHLFQVLLHM